MTSVGATHRRPAATAASPKQVDAGDKENGDLEPLRPTLSAQMSHHAAVHGKRRSFRQRVSTRHACLLVALLLTLLLGATMFSGHLPSLPGRGGPGGPADYPYRRLELHTVAPAYDVSVYAPGTTSLARLQTRERYLDALVCKGFCNQVMSLYDAVATAYLLNATLVLPSFYTGFDYFSAFVAMSEKDLSYDPQTLHSVPMEFFFDTQHFAQSLRPLVKVTMELPAHLQTYDSSTRLPPVGLDPSHPETLENFKLWLEEHDVLRLRCVLGTMRWTTKELGALRNEIHRAVRPSSHLQNLVNQFKQQIKTTVPTLPAMAPGQYLGVHLRHESDWRTYCDKEAKVPDISYVSSYADCYYDAAGVAKYVTDNQLSSTPLVFVATGKLSTEEAMLFMTGSATGVVTLDYVCTKAAGPNGCVKITPVASEREIRAAVSFFLLEAAGTVTGNLFSSFTWTLRERRCLLATNSPTHYYNRPKGYGGGDIKLEEAGRWNVFPGTSLLHLEGGRATKVSSLEVQSSKYWDNGYLHLQGLVQVAEPSPPPELVMRVDNGQVTTLLANRADRTSKTAWRFDASYYAAGLLGRRGRQVVSIKLCAAAAQERCSPPVVIELSPPLMRRSTNDSVAYMYFPRSDYASGGPEALHQLHQAINYLHSRGSVDVRSVFPYANKVYKGPYSVFADKLEPFDVGPADYVVFPEHYTQNPPWWPYVFQQTGALPVVWFIGQHVTNHEDDLRDKPFYRPLCLTRYFASVHDCPNKAILNTPMSETFHRRAEAYDTSGVQKDDIVLLDIDDNGFFDPSRLKLPKSARLVPMAGYDRSQIISLYERAKVYVDTYLTGMERGVFESCLFHVVPIVAHNGQAQDRADFPIAEKWRWTPWDYDALSDTIRRALEHHDEAVADTAPLREYVRRMPATFLEQVRVYYADHVHFMVGTTPKPDDGLPPRLARGSAAASLAWLTLGYPLATSEALADNPFYLQYDYTGIFRSLQVRAHSRTVGVSKTASEFARMLHVPPQYLQPPQHQHYSRWIMVLPSGVVPLSPGYVASLSEIARSKHLTLLMDNTQPGHGPVLLVDRQAYYPAVAQLLLVLEPETPFSEFVRLVCEVRGMACGEVLPGEGAPSQGPSSPVCSLLAFRGKVPLSCCASVREVAGHRLWRYAIDTLQPDDPLHAWLGGLARACKA